VSLLIKKGALINSRTKVSYLYSHICIIVDDKVYSHDDYNADSYDDDNVDSHDDEYSVELLEWKD
jgi:hypothetical protein